ncbi:hypothetical protein Tco_1358307 [Tanacetum coccineum]
MRLLLVAGYGGGVRMMAYDGDGVGCDTSRGGGVGLKVMKCWLRCRDGGVEMGRGGEVAVVERAASMWRGRRRLPESRRKLGGEMGWWLGKEKEKSNTTLKYPPGFTPVDELSNKEETFVPLNDEEKVIDQKNKEQDIDKEDSSNRGASLSKEDGNESRCSGRFRRTEEPRTGGSILKLLEDVVKVGQTMGLEMDGCVSNIEDIIKSRGENEAYQ